MYVALRDSGALAQLEADGVSGLFQFSVDNALCHVADPTFLGFCHSQKAECAALTVPKLHPHEPVGVLARSGGRPAVVEYSELSEEMKVATDKKGRLLYSAAHICINYFSIPFIRRFVDDELVRRAPQPCHHHSHRPARPRPSACAWRGAEHAAAPRGEEEDTLPRRGGRARDAGGAQRRQARDVHLRLLPGGQKGARGPSTAADPSPQTVHLHPTALTPRPTSSAQLVAFEVPRDECFAPVKNAPGSGKADSPDTARAMISHLNRRRLEAAGAKLPPAVAGELIEVSPLVSYQGEGLGAYKKKKLEVHPALLIE